MFKERTKYVQNRAFPGKSEGIIYGFLRLVRLGGEKRHEGPRWRREAAGWGFDRQESQRPFEYSKLLGYQGRDGH